MFQYITANPEILGGKPCIKGTRLSVEFILELFASGATQGEILQTYPNIKREALEEALRFTAESHKHDNTLLHTKISS
jgi:uncharacterized protein (DUF433 family)